MAGHDRGRRRFLRGLAALVGVAGAGVLGLRRWGDATPAPARSTTTPPAASPPSSAPSTAAATTTTESPGSPTTTVSPATTPPPAAELAVLCRAAWGALPVAGTFTPHVIQRLTVHHTAAFLEDNAQAPAQVRRHQQHHIDRGWPDLAYHFVIDAAGNVYQGRPIDAVGDTGTDYDPTGHFLVCCEGNFDEQEITDPQLDALVAVLAWAAITHDVPPDTIRGHRDWAATSCPGDLLHPLISSGELNRAVAGRITDGPVALTVVCGEEGAQRVAAIERGSA